MRRSIVKFMMIPLTAVALAFSGTAQPASAIIGGSAATSPEGIVSITRNGKFQCTGVVVADRWVLTAKHCFFDDSYDPYPPQRIPDSELKIRVGSLDWRSGGQLRSIQDSDVRTSHDIAMIKLTTSVGDVPVKFATADTSVGDIDNVFGWGSVNPCDPGCSPSNTLQKGKVVVETVNATDLYGGRAIRSGPAASPSRPCRGDSGGPIFDLIDNKRYLVGIVSGGNVGNCLGYTYYASVIESKTWILNRIANY